MEAHRLLPPSEVAGQACWCCGREPVETMFGWQPKLVEIQDAYGKLVLCIDCLADHLSMLRMEQGNARLKDDKQVNTPWIRREGWRKPKERKLPTFKEWSLTASIEEIEAVLANAKKRMKGGEKK